MMNKLTKEEIKHIAKLAMLDLKGEEEEKFSGQLTDILNFVNKISTLDTNDTIALSNVTGKKNVMREDEIKPSLSLDKALKNAPETHKGYFKVKAVFEK